MKFPRRTFLQLAVGAAALPAVPRISRAQAYPSRPVRIVVGFAAGGATDIQARLMGQWLSERLGQQFIIDNRPGGGGVAGMKAVATSPPDGYTLSMIGGGLTIAKSLFKFLPYDLEKDFVPISTTAAYGLLVATKRSSSLKSMQDILATAQRDPGKLNFGTINPGSAQHLSAELFRTLARIDVTMVPYKTTPELLTGLLRGDIDVAFEYDAGLRPALEDRSILAVAFTGPVRAAHIPDVPTVAEAGLPQVTVRQWAGVYGPAKLAREIVERLNKEVNTAVNRADVREKLQSYGYAAEGSTPERLLEINRDDLALWRKLVREANIPLE